MLDYDVAVIGAGPAGSTAARAISEEGFRVLIIEKKTNVGLPVHCAGYIPRLLLRKIDLHPKAVIQKIDFMRSYLPNGEVVEINAPGFMVERSLFDKDLAMKATDAGAHLMTKTTATALKSGLIVTRNGSKNREVRARVIIGADGAKSTVGSWANEKNRNFIIAMQNEIMLKKPLKGTEVYFDLEYEGGYAWLFPRDRTAYAGIGINYRHGGKIRQKFEHFLNRLKNEDKITRDGVIGRSVGLIPVSGYLNTVPDENILLVGDAAGHTDPITGAGILAAIHCGQIAGKIAAEAVKKNDLRILNKYEVEWKNLLQRPLDRALQKRRFLDAHWNKQELRSVLRKTWVAFGDYWSEK